MEQAAGRNAVFMAKGIPQAAPAQHAIAPAAVLSATARALLEGWTATAKEDAMRLTTQADAFVKHRMLLLLQLQKPSCVC